MAKNLDLRNKQYKESKLNKESADFSREDWNDVSLYQSLTKDFMLSHIDDINWSLALENKNIDIPEEVLSNNKVASYLDWDKLSVQRKFSPQFIQNNPNRVNIFDQLEYHNFTDKELALFNWVEIAKNKDIAENIILKYNIDLNFIPWDTVDINKFSEKFFLAKSRDINWKKLLSNPNVNEDFISNHMNEFNISELYDRELSEDFIIKHEDELDWNKLCKTQNLSENIIESKSDKINWNEIRKNKVIQLNDEFKNKYEKELKTIPGIQEEFNEHLADYNLDINNQGDKDKIEILNNMFRDGFDARQIASIDLSKEQLRMLSNIIATNIYEDFDITPYANPNLTIKQMQAIRAAEIEFRIHFKDVFDQIDMTRMADPMFTVDRINEMKTYALNGQDYEYDEYNDNIKHYLDTGYSLSQATVLVTALENNINMEDIQGRNYSGLQLQEFLTAKEKGIDTRLIADSKLLPEQMRLIITAQEKNQNIDLDHVKKMDAKLANAYTEALEQNVKINLLPFATTPEQVKLLTDLMIKAEKAKTSIKEGISNGSKTIANKTKSHINKICEWGYEKTKNVMETPSDTEKSMGKSSSSAELNEQLGRAVRYNLKHLDNQLDLNDLINKQLSASQISEIIDNAESGVKVSDMQNITRNTSIDDIKSMRGEPEKEKEEPKQEQKQETPLKDSIGKKIREAHKQVSKFSGRYVLDTLPLIGTLINKVQEVFNKIKYMFKDVIEEAQKEVKKNFEEKSKKDKKDLTAQDKEDLAKYKLQLSSYKDMLKILDETEKVMTRALRFSSLDLKANSMNVIKTYRNDFPEICFVPEEINKETVINVFYHNPETNERKDLFTLDKNNVTHGDNLKIFEAIYKACLLEKIEKGKNILDLNGQEINKDNIDKVNIIINKAREMAEKDPTQTLDDIIDKTSDILKKEIKEFNKDKVKEQQKEEVEPEEKEPPKDKKPTLNIKTKSGEKNSVTMASYGDLTIKCMQDSNHMNMIIGKDKDKKTFSFTLPEKDTMLKNAEEFHKSIINEIIKLNPEQIEYSAIKPIVNNIANEIIKNDKLKEPEIPEGVLKCTTKEDLERILNAMIGIKIDDVQFDNNKLVLPDNVEITPGQKNILLQIIDENKDLFNVEKETIEKPESLSIGDDLRKAVVQKAIRFSNEMVANMQMLDDDVPSSDIQNVFENEIDKLFIDYHVSVKDDTISFNTTEKTSNGNKKINISCSLKDGSLKDESSIEETVDGTEIYSEELLENQEEVLALQLITKIYGEQIRDIYKEKTLDEILQDFTPSNKEETNANLNEILSER